jgi:hypothetical protein
VPREHSTDPPNCQASLHAAAPIQLSCAVRIQGSVSTHEPLHAENTHKDNLRLIQLLLHPHDRIRLPGILVFLDVRVDIGERDRGRVVIGGLGYFGSKFIEDLC